MAEDARLQRHLHKLYVYALSLTRDEDRARDLVQDCALRALDARRPPSEDSVYRAWLFRILRNRFIDICRRGEPLPLDESDDTPDAGGWRGDERLIDAITVRIAIARLAEPQREILTLVDMVGLSYAEAAETLDIPKGTVMSRLARARQALLREIQTQNIVPVAAARKRALGRT